MITFQSRATASVMMFDEVAKSLLEIMGKSYSATGIITLEQLPEALARLTQAAEQDRARTRSRAEPETEDEEAAEDSGAAAAGPISLAQRAVPLIDMLTRSLSAREPVIWG